MAIKINISGVQMDGAELFNGVNIRGNSEVDIDIKNSSIGKNSQVLNDVKLQNGKLTYRANGVRIDENARVMNGREIKDGETVVINHKDSYYTETTQRSQVQQKDKATKRASIIEMLARVFRRSSRTIEESVRTDNNDSRAEFVNMINGNGEYRKPEYSQITPADDRQDKAKEITRTQSQNGR